MRPAGSADELPVGSELPTRVVVGAIAATIAGILPAFLIGGVAVQAGADLGFDAGGLGVAVAVSFGTAAVTSALLGRGVERLGAERALRGTSIAAAIVMLAIAGAPDLVALTVGLAAAGAINAMAQPAANLLLARGVHPSRQGVAFGMKQSAMPAATMLAGFAVPLLAVPFGWEWSYVAGAALAAVAALLVPSPPPVVPPATGRTRGAAGRERPRPDAPLGPLVVLAVGVGFGAAAAGALAAFLVSAATEAGIGDSAAGYLLVAGSVVGIAVRVLVGVRADRRGEGHLRVVAGMLVGGAAAFALYALDSATWLVVATPIAFGLGWAWPGLFNFSIVRNNPTAPAAATGITQTGTYLGATVGPLAFGWLADHGSYPTAWTVGAAWYLVGAVAMVVGRRMLRAARQSRGVAAGEAFAGRGATPAR